MGVGDSKIPSPHEEQSDQQSQHRNDLLEGDWPTSVVVRKTWPDLKEYEEAGLGISVDGSELLSLQDGVVDKSIPVLASIVEDPTKDFSSWFFCIWSLDSRDLHTLATAVMQIFDFTDRYKITALMWSKFMIKVEKLMDKTINPFHNFHHVVDTMQTTAVFLQNFQCGDIVSRENHFVLVLTALLHDIEHPGTNNRYQINAGTELAIRYNDQSVLENHHISVALQILQESDTNILHSLDKESKTKFRADLIAIILATDMSVHFNLHKELGDVLKRNEAIFQRSASPVGLSQKDQQTLLKSIVHAADISSAAKVRKLMNLFNNRKR